MNTPTGKMPNDWHETIRKSLLYGSHQSLVIRNTPKEIQKLRDAWFEAYPRAKAFHRAIKEKIMINQVNEALDKGWRLREAGPPGVWCLVPADVIEKDVGFTVKDTNTFQLIVPIADIETWLKARVIITPDEKKRNDLKCKVVNWMSAEWNSYLTECDDDEVYAKEIIIADASSDFNISEDDAKEWFDARNN